MIRSDLPDLSGILVIDKPAGWTSHDVVARVRRLAGMKRVGHGGTLDPFATGVLPVAVGMATRILQYVQASDKGYAAQIVLGAETDSGDVDGVVVARASSDSWPTYSSVEIALRQFIGTTYQTPPALSAIKIDGIPLHRRVRAGEHVEVPSRRVTIHRIELVGYDPPNLFVSIACGSGTYIRSLARDLGRNLGCFGYCHALRRTNAGPFCLGDALRLDDLEQSEIRTTWPSLAQQMDMAVSDLPVALLGEMATTRWYHGRSLESGSIVDTQEVSPIRVYDSTGRFAGIGTPNAAGGMAPQLVIPLTEGTTAS